MPDSVQKAFITQDGQTQISCPACSRARKLDVSKFENKKKEIRLKVTCPCSHVFRVILERRRHFRKAVDFRGVIRFRDRQAVVRVSDLSRHGLKIHTTENLDLEIEEKVVVEFTLDDASESHVSKEMIIKNIGATSCGLAFTSSEHYDRLGNYMAFQLA